MQIKDNNKSSASSRNNLKQKIVSNCAIQKSQLLQYWGKQKTGQGLCQ